MPLRRKLATLNPPIKDRSFCTPFKGPARPWTILLIIPFINAPENWFPAHVTKLSTLSKTDFKRFFTILPSPLTIFPATHEIASSNFLTGLIIAVCAATPAKCAIPGFSVAANTFAKTVLNNNWRPFLRSGISLLKRELNICPTMLFAIETIFSTERLISPAIFETFETPSDTLSNKLVTSVIIPFTAVSSQVFANTIFLPTPL